MRIFLIFLFLATIGLCNGCNKQVPPEQAQLEDIPDGTIIKIKEISYRHKKGDAPHDETIVLCADGKKIVFRGKCLLPLPRYPIKISGVNKWECPDCLDIKSWRIFDLLF